MYDLVAENGQSVWIPNLSKDAPTAFPFTMPNYPCEIVITHAASMEHLAGPDMSAHASLTSGDMGLINPQKVGNAESIIAMFKNVRGKGAAAATYIAPGASAFLNVTVAANRRPPNLPQTVTFGLLSDITKL